MSWYRDGTISVASGSKAVTGTNTTFNDTAAGVNPGDMIIVGGQFLEVASVNNATSITTVNAATADVTDASYQIVTTLQMSNASLAKKVAAAMDRILLGVSNWMLIFKGSGTITITNYDGSTATGLAWPSLTDIAQRSMVVNDTQLTTVNAIMDSNIYTVNAGATGLPSGVSTSGLLENVKYSTAGISQKFKTASATSGQLNREFLRYGVITNGVVTWTTWAEQYTTVTKPALTDLSGVLSQANGGTGSSSPFGTAAGTFAQGNDSRIDGALQKSGGTMTGQLVQSAKGGFKKNTSGWTTNTNDGYNYMIEANGPDTSTILQHTLYVSNGNYWASRFILTVSGNFKLWEMRNDGSFRSDGTVYASGTALTSDRRLKSNFQPIDYDIDTIDKIVPQRYDKGTPSDLKDITKELGIVAQDLQAVLPDLVSEYYWNEEYPDLLSINYSGLTAWLVGYVANLKDLVKTHEGTISDLENRVARLEALLVSSDQ